MNKRTVFFASRNTKEILRDPINLFFGIGFPLVLLLLLTAIQSNIPADMFEIEKLSPGMCVFGLSFVSLFSATLISKDRGSSFLMRLFSSPLTAADYVLGYTLPLIPMCVLQSVVCFAAAMCLGLQFNMNILLTIAVLVPSYVLYISLGLLFGSILNDKQVGGVCGALLTNLSAWLSGIWFDIDLVGGVFKGIANVLPFYHATEAVKAACTGNYSGIMNHLWVVIAYAAAITVIAVLAFSRKMKKS